MPDIGQVRTACYRVMRLQGLAGVSTPAVAEMMKNVGVRPGSYRDLHWMVTEWRAEQAKITELPPHVVGLANAFAKTVWEIAYATRIETQLQQSEPEPVRRARPRRLAEAPRGHGRLRALTRAVEYKLRPGGAVTEPISGADLLLELTDTQAGLTDEDHFVRDLLKIAENHEFIYRLEGSKKWWWRGRELPDGYGPDGKKKRRYVRTGGPLSVVRTAHETLKNDVMATLAKAKQGLTKEELADDQHLNIPEDKQERFFAMLRNQLRAKPENKLWEFAGGKYRLLKRLKDQ